MSEDKKNRLSAKQVQEDLTGKLDKVVESTNEAIYEIEGRIESLDGKLNKILDAVNNPVTISKTFEPMEQKLGNDPVREPFVENGEVVIEPANFGDPNQPEFKAKADNLAFMEETVIVHIHDTSEKNADQVFDVSVNGDKVVFIRGKNFKVKRKFVEGLARAKPISYGNEKYTDANGDEQYRYPTRSGLRYSFSVLEDKNPRGKAWLQKVLAEA